MFPDLSHILSTLKALIDIVTALRGLPGWFREVFSKKGLDATGTAKQVVDGSLEAITTGQDPQAIERTRAAADLVRSFALFGFLEYLLWATQAVFLFLIVAEVRKMADRFADLFPSRSGRG